MPHKPWARQYMVAAVLANVLREILTVVVNCNALSGRNKWSCKLFGRREDTDREISAPS